MQSFPGPPKYAKSWPKTSNTARKAIILDTFRVQAVAFCSLFKAAFSVDSFEGACFAWLCGGGDKVKRNFSIPQACGPKGPKYPNMERLWFLY